MKSRSVTLLLVLIFAISGTVFLGSRTDSTTFQCNKACLPEKKAVPVEQNQGNSPDEFHYGSINRLILSVIR